MSEVALFDVEPGIPPERTKARVAKTFRRFEPDQVLFLPPSLDEWLQLGVRPDLGFGRLEVVPQLPPGQDHIAASNILVGAGTVGVTAMHRATTYTPSMHGFARGSRSGSPCLRTHGFAPSN